MVIHSPTTPSEILVSIKRKTGKAVLLYTRRARMRAVRMWAGDLYTFNTVALHSGVVGMDLELR